MLLIVCESKRIARSVSDTFHYMSILSYGATPYEGLSEISSKYSAVLIINPESLPDVYDYIKRLRSYMGRIPIFGVTDTDPPARYSEVFDGIFTKPTFTPALAKKIISYAKENNRTYIGEYFLAGFDASSYQRGVLYFDTEVNLTKTEAMILRYLIKTYPQPQKPEKIIKYAFKHGRAPEPTSIRTHLSLMNKKFMETIGRKMIINEPGKGYLIVTPRYIYCKTHQE